MSRQVAAIEGKRGVREALPDFGLVGCPVGGCGRSGEASGQNGK